MPVISVIVPVYNVEDNIRRCIKSILNQTFTDFELILVDDGSPDRCPEICDEYSLLDNRVIVVHQPNKGVSAARNTGLEIAQGKYVAFADSDDYVDKEWLHSLYSEAVLSGAEIVMSGIIWIDSSNYEISRTIRKSGTWLLRSDHEIVNYILNNVLFNGNGWEVWTTLYDNELIKKHKIRFCLSCHNFAEDMGFMLDCILYCSKITAINDCHYYYIQHDSSMMAKSKMLVKIDSVNEISFEFGKRFFEVIKDNSSQQLYPLIHYLILWNQYQKINLSSHERTYITNTKKEIHNLYWHDKWLRSLFLCKDQMNQLMGKSASWDAVVNSRFFAYRSLLLFRIEKNLVKWVVKRVIKN